MSEVFAYEDGSACGYYRIRLPFDEMRKHGVDVEYARGGGVPESARVVVGQRVGGVGHEHDWLRVATKARLVYETDDDLWTIDPYNVRAAAHYTPSVLAATEHVMRMARLVTVSTAYLAETLGRFNRNTVVLPNTIDAAMLDLERPSRDRIVVGWAGGDSHHRDLADAAPHLRRFFARHPEVDLHTIGWGSHRSPADFPAHLRPYVRANPLHTMGVEYRHTYWQADPFDYYAGIDFDIGIAPLVANDFNRSKSAIKAMEYGALGVPVVASDVGPYREYVRHGETGFLVRAPHEWGRYLHALVSDEAMRTEMGAAARREAAKWTIQDLWPAWAAAYRSLL